MEMICISESECGRYPNVLGTGYCSLFCYDNVLQI